MFIQKQKAAGTLAKRWDKTGVILEIMGFNRYTVKVGGSGSVTNRNCCFLKSFKPAMESTLTRGPRPDACLHQVPASPLPVASAQELLH